MVISIFILLLISSSLSEGRRFQCKTVEPVTCPPCEIRLEDTYLEFGLKYMNSSAPSNGTCNEGTYTWIFYAKDYPEISGIHDGCCCLTPPTSDPIECTPEVPICPTFKGTGNFRGVGRNEKIGDYQIRVGETMFNAPTNGCCLPGYIKWIYHATLTNATQNICGCVPPSEEFVDYTYMCIDDDFDSL